jgi:succinate dehydrogenase / fumarate reductase membrane anchor subunit
VVKRVVVGAHYGLKDWLAQRITAIVVAVYPLWQALFANAAFRVATLLFWLALLWHAWIGVRDIWMDYIKPTALRLTLEVLTVLTLVGYAGWLIEILWGGAR